MSEGAVVSYYEPGSQQHEAACQALGLLVRDDGLRDGGHRWTVAIQGMSRGDGDSPGEAAAALRGNLIRERDHASDVVAAVREALSKARVRAEAAEARIAELEAEQ